MSKILKALIVDDENSSRNVLREYVRKYCADVNVVGEADSVSSALPLIREHNPDILFLDVEMPELNGFELLERLPEIPNLNIIFVHLLKLWMSFRLLNSINLFK